MNYNIFNTLLKEHDKDNNRRLRENDDDSEAIEILLEEEEIHKLMLEAEFNDMTFNNFISKILKEKLLDVL